jgi:hypothetical protein
MLSSKKHIPIKLALGDIMALSPVTKLREVYRHIESDEAARERRAGNGDGI